MSPVSSALGLVTAFKPIPKQHANVHTLSLVRSFLGTHIWIFTFQIKNILCNMQDVFGHHNTIVQYEFALDTYIYIEFEPSLFYDSGPRCGKRDPCLADPCDINEKCVRLENMTRTCLPGQTKLLVLVNIIMSLEIIFTFYFSSFCCFIDCFSFFSCQYKLFIMQFPW